MENINLYETNNNINVDITKFTFSQIIDGLQKGEIKIKIYSYENIQSSDFEDTLIRNILTHIEKQ